MTDSLGIGTIGVLILYNFHEALSSNPRSRDSSVSRLAASPWSLSLPAKTEGGYASCF